MRAVGLTDYICCFTLLLEVHWVAAKPPISTQPGALISALNISPQYFPWSPWLQCTLLIVLQGVLRHCYGITSWLGLDKALAEFLYEYVHLTQTRDINDRRVSKCSNYQWTCYLYGVNAGYMKGTEAEGKETENSQAEPKPSAPMVSPTCVFLTVLFWTALTWKDIWKEGGTAWCSLSHLICPHFYLSLAMDRHEL